VQQGSIAYGARPQHAARRAARRWPRTHKMPPLLAVGARLGALLARRPPGTGRGGTRAQAILQACPMVLRFSLKFGRWACRCIVWARDACFLSGCKPLSETRPRTCSHRSRTNHGAPVRNKLVGNGGRCLLQPPLVSGLRLPLLATDVRCAPRALRICTACAPGAHMQPALRPPEGAHANAQLVGFPTTAESPANSAWLLRYAALLLHPLHRTNAFLIFGTSLTAEPARSFPAVSVKVIYGVVS